jgi:hypothetical protein
MIQRDFLKVMTMIQTIDKSVEDYKSNIFKKIRSQAHVIGMSIEETNSIITKLEERYKNDMRLLKIPGAIPRKTSTNISKKVNNEKKKIQWRLYPDKDYSFTVDIKYGDNIGFIKDNKINKIVYSVSLQGNPKELTEDDVKFLVDNGYSAKM